MGDVYLAEDPRLQRKVALKRPSDEWVTRPEARARLRREAQAVARLHHPNIAAIFDVLDADGHPYIVMEYVDGESLAACLRHGRLPVGRAVEIGIGVAEAVAEAHAHGVLHRDLKPANVCLTRDGRVKVLDFGLARVRATPAHPAVSSLEQSLEEADRFVGTPGYAAPEQLTGGTTDQRSDIYAIGVLLFEMATGRLPFSGRDPLALALQTLTEPAPDAHAVDARVPPELSSVIARALEKNPDARHLSAAHLLAELRRIRSRLAEQPTAAASAVWGAANPPAPRPARGASRVAVAWGAATVLTIAAAFVGSSWMARRPGPRLETPVVAVLPFSTLGEATGSSFFGPGFADVVRTSLAAVPHMAIVSGSDIAEARQRHRDPNRLARALGATWLVSGTVQQVADRLQVSVELESPDGRIRWGRVFGGARGDVLALQLQVAEALADHLRGSLTAPDRQRLADAQTSNASALVAYYRGREHLDRLGAEAAGGAVAAFEEATRLDPAFALAYAGLGEAYWRQYQVTREPTLPARALEAAERGRRLAPDHPAIRYTLAVIYDGSGRRGDAIAELRGLLAINPDDEAARRLLGDVYLATGEVEQGLAEYRRALDIRPNFARAYRSLGLAYLDLGRHDEAIAAFSRIIELGPDEPSGYQLRGTAYHYRLDLARAAADYEAALARGKSAAAYSNLGTVYYQLGRYEAARRAYAEAIALRPNSATTHRNLGDAYRRLGRMNEARLAYEQAIDLARRDLQVNPADARTLALAAICKARLGRRDDSRRDAEAAVALAPDDAWVVYKSGAALAIAGRHDQALVLLGRALGLGYSAALARLDDDLATLNASPAFAALMARAEPQSRQQGEEKP